MKKRLPKWYSLEVMKQLDSGINVEEIEDKPLLWKLKPIHATWLIELYIFILFMYNFILCLSDNSWKTNEKQLNKN